METLGTEPVEENQHAMQLLIRDLVLAGMIIEGTEGAILEVLRKLMEDEDITEEDKISVLRQLREGADAGRNGLTQERKADSMRRGRSYMPDIDGRDRIGRLLGRGLLLPMAIFRHYTKMIILEQHGYSFNGERTAERSLTALDLLNLDELDWNTTNDIEIYSLKFALESFALFPEFPKIVSFLDLAPCLDWQIKEQGHYGLGRRFISPKSGLCDIHRVKGKKRHKINEDTGSYHIWFILPFSHIKEDKEHQEYDARVIEQGAGEILAWHPAHLPIMKLSFKDSIRCFYMKFDVKSRSTKIFATTGEEESETFNEICQRSVQRREQYNPFMFLCSSISELLHGWVEQGYFYFRKIREVENTVLDLGKSFDQAQQPGSRDTREIKQENLQRARKLMLELHELRSHQSRVNLNFGYLSSIINESLDEHHDIREILSISLTTYLEVEKNLCTLCSWVQAMKQNLESAQNTIDSCLSTLSLLLNMRNNYSVEENTRFLATMAEHSRKENHQVKDIAEATQKDSEAMKTIAIMTMFYLPASFVATLFSMGIFNFDFESGRSGKISLSSYWWIYAVVTIPLTICTFFFFWFMQGRQQNECKATAAKVTE